jgi:hypothetical protein
MEKKFKSPRGGMIVFLSLALTALWLIAVFGTYEDSQREKYEVRITPGAVSYGTHSMAVMPAMVSPTHRSSVPMVSGGAVRSYAHYGHATMPKASASSGYRMHTTSSATVKTIGSGSGGGAGTGIASGSSSSSRGITYGGGSVSMPVLAVNSSILTTSSISAAETSAPRAIRPRRIKPTGTGEDGEWRYGGNNPEDPSDWWYYDDYAGDDGDWVQVSAGNTRPANDGTGNQWLYTGSTWVLVDDNGNPVNPQPLGATPWLMMMLLACAYACYKYYCIIRNNYIYYEKSNVFDLLLPNGGIYALRPKRRAYLLPRYPYGEKSGSGVHLHRHFCFRLFAERGMVLGNDF